MVTKSGLKQLFIFCSVALNSTHIIYAGPNLISALDMMLTVIILSFVDRRCGWGVFYTCEYEHFTCTCITTNSYIYSFDSLLALNSTHIIYEVPNLISAIDMMLIVIILSLIDWWRGWGVFITLWTHDYYVVHIIMCVGVGVPNPLLLWLWASVCVYMHYVFV